MVIGGMAFLVMTMTNWMALSYAYYSYSSHNETNTEGAMWI